MKNPKKKPSSIAMSLFNWFCHPDYREEIEGDLMERFNYNLTQFGYNRANQLFIKDVFFLFRPSLIGNINHLTNTNTMLITKQNQRAATILAIVITILLIPLVAMNFSNEVNWKFMDFVVAGILLSGAGFGIDLILRKIKIKGLKLLFVLLVLVLLFLIWAELAVGILGTPLAGS